VIGAVTQPTWRQRAHTQLEPRAWPGGGLSPTNKAVCVLIVLSALVAIVETEPGIHGGHERLFSILNWLFVVLFTLEYGVRLWASAESLRYGPGPGGRLRFLLSPAALVDLLALAAIVLALAGSEAFILRLLRLARILRLARFGGFSDAMECIAAAIRSRGHELLLSVLAGLVLLTTSATLLHLVEGDAQPEDFGSIPRAMWWAVVTLTTVGYGDAYPISVPGRLLAALTAIAGIGLIAMPTGILAAAFSEAMQRQRREREHHDADRHQGHDCGP
jgi:voltage-gated potassium channel